MDTGGGGVVKGGGVGLGAEAERSDGGRHGSGGHDGGGDGGGRGLVVVVPEGEERGRG